jgi:diguanylate cyclase (GGDEF)-like protein
MTDEGPAPQDSVLQKRLSRALARALAAESIAEDTSRKLYLEQQRLQQVLASETRLKNELETLLDAMEAFLQSSLQLPTIAAELYRFINQVLPCDGMRLSIDGLEATFEAGDTGVAHSASQPGIDDPALFELRIPMSLGTDGRGVVTLLSSSRWSPNLDLRLPRILTAGASGAVKNALAMDRVRQRSLTDSLTGLLNRRGFDIAASSAQSACRRNSRPLSAAMIDVDLFKAVNDAYGHAAGDEVLVEIARVFQERTRSGDVVARIGGEEFALVLPDAPLSAACQLAERIRLAVENLQFESQQQQFTVTVSIGVAEANMSESLEQLLARADGALYRAKSAGRDRWLADP